MLSTYSMSYPISQFQPGAQQLGSRWNQNFHQMDVLSGSCPKLSILPPLTGSVLPRGGTSTSPARPSSSARGSRSIDASENAAPKPRAPSLLPPLMVTNVPDCTQSVIPFFIYLLQNIHLFLRSGACIYSGELPSRVLQTIGQTSVTNNAALSPPVRFCARRRGRPVHRLLPDGDSPLHDLAAMHS